MIWVGIIGAKGYFGEALSKLIAGHPKAQVSTVMDSRELYDAELYMHGSEEAGPGYRNMLNAVRKSDIIFNGLHGSIAEEIYKKAISSGKRIIDISDDCFIGDGVEGKAADAYPGSIYGLSELYKDKMKNAAVAANPSSFCTGAVLGLSPLAAGNIIDLDSAVIESKSGITGLRSNDRLVETGMTGNNGIKIYKVDCTDYSEEVNEQMFILFGKKAAASYTSYMIPGFKGITTTIKAKPCQGIGVSDVPDIFRDFYRSNPFVEVCSGSINQMKGGFKKCFCKIAASVDADTGNISVTTVLDDALRGAASQAIQTMNLMYGIDGKIGL